jgi:hypothetical protein
MNLSQLLEWIGGGGSGLLGRAGWNTNGKAVAEPFSTRSLDGLSVSEEFTEAESVDSTDSDSGLDPFPKVGSDTELFTVV